MVDVEIVKIVELVEGEHTGRSETGRLELSSS